MGFYQNYHIRKVIGRGKDIELNLHREQLQKQTVYFVNRSERNDNSDFCWQIEGFGKI